LFVQSSEKSIQIVGFGAEHLKISAKVARIDSLDTTQLSHGN